MSILAGEKFELRLLPLDGVLLHEESEHNRSEKLINRFKNENVLLNPLIVGRAGDKYILLDGANRYEALKTLECRSILAQIVEYDSDTVELKTWYHFVNDMKLSSISEFIPEDMITNEFTEGMLAENTITVVSEENEFLYIKLPSELEKRLAIFSAVNRYYDENFTYTRIDSDTDISDIKKLAAGNGLLFIYPQLKKSDIVKIAGLNQKLPAGISRHMIPNRVLHIKFLIDSLKSSENLEKKNIEIEKYIQYKIDTGKVRLYREPILIFDE